MSTVEARLATLIADAMCAMPPQPTVGAKMPVDHIAAHVAAVITSAADLAVVSLPKPDVDAEYGQVWEGNDVLGTVQVRPDGSIESRGDFEYEHTVEEMRAAAGVAAAAAKAAEVRHG